MMQVNDVKFYLIIPRINFGLPYSAAPVVQDIYSRYVESYLLKSKI